MSFSFLRAEKWKGRQPEEADALFTGARGKGGYPAWDRNLTSIPIDESHTNSVAASSSKTSLSKAGLIETA